MAAKKYLDWAGLQAYNAKVAAKIAAAQTAATPIEDDGSVTVTTVANGGGQKLSVNVDGTTITKGTGGVLSAVIPAADAYTLTSVTPSGNNVKEEYALAKNGTAISGGTTIKIYKDSALLAVKLSKTTASWDSTNNVIVDGSGTTDALAFAYEDKNGAVQVVTVDVADFLRESEFGNGLDVTNGVVSVDIDTTSEKVRIAAGDNGLADVLSVTSDGVKVNNIQDAIDYAVSNAAAAAKTEINTNTVASGSSGINIAKDSTSGHDVYTITGVGYAADSALTSEINRAKSAETAIDGALGLTKGTNNETRTWTNTTNYKDTTNVDAQHNMQAIDTQLKSVSDKVGEGFTPITYNDANNATYNGTAGVTTGGEIDSLFA